MTGDPGTEELAADALLAMGRYLAGAQLYPAGHRGRERLLEDASSAVRVLLKRAPTATFSFLDGEVVFRDTSLPSLEGWSWTMRLRDAGVGRLELSRGVDRDELKRFLDHVSDRIVGEASGPPDGPLPNVAWGELEVARPETPGEEGAPAGVVTLGEEARTVEWLHARADREGRIPALETVVAVQTLAVAMHGARELVTPFVRLARTDAYTAGHCINVAILSMTLGEHLDRSGRAVPAIGTAALLHDIGKVAVPDEILNKEGSLDEDEWSEIRRHPVAGSRILMESGGQFRLAAAVAYEHHLDPEGEGYPELHWPRPPCDTAQLVQVCDLYDALRSSRPYRDALPPERVRKILREERGETLAPGFVDAFLDLVQQWDPEEHLRERPPDSAGPDRLD